MADITHTGRKTVNTKVDNRFSLLENSQKIPTSAAVFAFFTRPTRNLRALNRLAASAGDTREAHNCHNSGDFFDR
jgi:hypothetical protein